jgi:hypothetical protein
MAETAKIEMRSDDGDDSQGPLLRLYWNRAGVKRELSALKRERHELLDKLKEQEGAIIRAKEQLDGLERLLTNPLAAANAMVYFQLRHLWRVAAQQIEQFARELRTQRERRELAKLHEAALAKRRRRLSAINEKLQSILAKEHNVIQERDALQKRLENMNGFLRVFRGPGIRRRLSGLGKGREALLSRIEELEELQDKINGEPLPESSGLSTDSRRLINLAVIALAQELVLHFSEHNLASFAKTSTQRPVGDMKFGDRRDCDRLVERIRARIGDLRDQKKTADGVKVRTDFLLTQVRYTTETDSVPQAESLDVIAPQVPAAGEGIQNKRASDAPLRLNVLSEDYWDLLSVLL